MNGFARIEGGEVVPVEKILGLNPSDKERQKIEETEGALLGHQLTANIVSEFPLKTTNRKFVFRPGRFGRDWITIMPHKHTAYEERAIEKRGKERGHLDWRLKAPPVEMYDLEQVIDNGQATSWQSNPERLVKQKTSQPAFYDGVLVTGISPDELLAFLGSYPKVYARYLEQKDLIEPICPSSKQQAAQCGARVLRLSEVNPRLLDISEPL